MGHPHRIAGAGAGGDHPALNQLPLLVALVCLFSAGPALAGIPVIVDTDAAPDDLRALGLLLENPEVDVLAVTTCDGVVAPERGLAQVRSLLSSLGHGDIPVAAGRVTVKEPPPCREFASSIAWGQEPPALAQDAVSAARLLVDVLARRPEPVTLIALGPLTNLADALALVPAPSDELSRVLWYGPVGPPWQGTNYELDTAAARTVLSTSLAVDGVDDGDRPGLAFDAAFLDSLAAVEGPLARLVREAFAAGEPRSRVESGWLGLWDELVVVYLLHPELFAVEQAPSHHRAVTPGDAGRVRQELLAMYPGTDHPDAVVLEHLPLVSEGYRADLAGWIEPIIDRHGEQEWRLAVLTSELHRHLGIWSILGVKMGLHARERLGAAHDDLEVVSRAGLTPPLSCLNDGLQVSTGATLGHGTIRVADEEPATPSATFIHGERRLTLQLRPEVAERIRAELSAKIEAHGGPTPAYFEDIRGLTLRYWLELDRDEVFEEP